MTGTEEHRLLEFSLHDLVRAVLWQLDVVEARVHAGERQVRDFAVRAVDRDVVLQAGEPTPRQSLRASQPLDELWTEGFIHLDYEPKEVIIGTTFRIVPVIWLNTLLELAKIFPFLLVHHFTADHVLNLALRREASNAVKRQDRIKALLEGLDLQDHALIEAAVQN